MVAHCMAVIEKIIAFKNPQQVPVVTRYQPIYNSMKQAQWWYPNCYGKGKFVIIMGGLHIEMTFLEVLSDCLEGSVSVDLTSYSGVKSPGRAAAALIFSDQVKHSTCNKLTFLQNRCC